MNDTDPTRIQWLLDFLQKDILLDGDGRVTTHRRGEMLDLCTDIDFYLLGPKAVLNDKDLVELTGGGEEGDGILAASDREDEIGRGQLLARFRASVLAGMDSVESEGIWRASEVHARGQRIDLRVGWALERQPDGTILQRYEEASPDAVLLAAASLLVAEWWPKLRRCNYDACRAWFLPRDKRQLYHEPTCRHRNFARNRERDYAEEHQRRVRRATGNPNIKTQKRKGGTR